MYLGWVHHQGVFSMSLLPNTDQWDKLPEVSPTIPCHHLALYWINPSPAAPSSAP